MLCTPVQLIIATWVWSWKQASLVATRHSNRCYFVISQFLGREALIMAAVGGVLEGTVSSKVELSISCSNLKDMDVFSKSDPVVFLYEQRGRELVKLGRTEVINDNLNPKVQ